MSKRKNIIPIIDLFAGPGGLSEGFSSVFKKNGERVFNIKLSIEKDLYAHETLRLRSFYRQFPKGKAPDLYYEYIKENEKEKKQQKLEELKKIFHKQWQTAEQEAWHYELPYPEEFDKDGNKKGGYTPEKIEERNKKIDKRIKEALKGEEEFALIGGPPCQAYSVVGRARNKGISMSVIKFVIDESNFMF